jgi:phosphomannomutase
MPIRFGTDGWRAVISEEFTFDNVRRVAQGIAHLFRETAGGRPPVAVVGFDTRFLSDRYAIEVARVLSGNGITVFLPEAATPTPAISFAITRLKAIGGVMLTASHNPPRYNGIKLKSAFGGSASAEECRRVESYTETMHELNMMDFDAAQTQGLIKRFDPRPDYFAHLETLVDRSIIAARPRHIVIDPMYGAGRGYLAQWLRDAGWDAIEIRGDLNPGFGGVHPEPIRKNLDATAETIALINSALPADSAATFALISDGDADRIGAMDEHGAFVDAHRIFALALNYLVEKRGWRGSVVKTVSTTLMLDRICRKHGLAWHETPVGFNHIADRMLSEDVLIGGEESGGISIKGHVPEGDGILLGALLAEIVAWHAKPLHQLVDELQATYGPAHYARRDLRLQRPLSKKDMVAKLLDEAPRSIAGMAVRQIKSDDGVKYLLEDDSWLLIRPSGTEPVLRVYAESSLPERVDQLLQFGEQIAARA